MRGREHRSRQGSRQDTGALGRHQVEWQENTDLGYQAGPEENEEAHLPFAPFLFYRF